MRKQYTLTEHERDEFERLLHERKRWFDAQKVRKFWREVAAARGLDYRTIIGDSNNPAIFTAMPLGHNKHWCWPMPLKCGHAPGQHF